MALRATRIALGGANPYYTVPRNATRTAMRENWKFTGRYLMLSHREQTEYVKRNYAYGASVPFLQSHFDVILTAVSWIAGLSIGICSAGFAWVYGLHFESDTQRAIYQIVFSLGTLWGSPGPVWFEEEARQKKIGLFFE
eukprot:TRINITY_DN419_c2_g2_i1.p1 TRINITY_DN419_c2_g2~~TRINITY_DN419_c2_g2_i1.p1  ORF type:complete len:139 (+),score=15.91 TRINITY_DN419_c2_g2_i1:47-463(+)